MLLKFRDRLKENIFLKNIITLFSGTLIAQVIPMLLSPVIARIYSPAAFGSLTLFVSIITVVGSVSAAKYEMAIILPAKRLEGQLLAWVSVLLVACTTILSAAAILIFSSELSVHLNEGLYFIPLSIALLGLTNVLTYWLGRSKKYMLLSQSKVAQSVGNGTAQVGLSQLQGSYFNGLIVAYLLGQVLFVGVAGKKFFIQLWRSRHLLTKDAILGILRKYRRFLSFYTPSALLDNASMQAPVFILSTYFSIASAGLFGLTYRIVNIPLSLISSAVGQVYYQKIAELKNEGHDLRPLVIDTAKKLFFLSIPPTVVLLFAGEFLFSYIFGEEWTASGHFAQVLAIPFAVRFIASPLSSVLVVNDKLKVLSLWQLFYFITTVSILYIGTFQPLTTFIYLYGINEVVQYLFYLFLIIKYSKR